MIKLSVNINKIATIRNARGGECPNVVEAAINCQKFGADGITIHPRQDERHITRKDVFDIKPMTWGNPVYTSSIMSLDIFLSNSLYLKIQHISPWGLQ